MKKQPKYPIGLKIGDLTVTSYSGTYTMTCNCGNTTSGCATFVQGKITNLAKEGFSGCMDCVYKYRMSVKSPSELYGIVYSNYKRGAAKRKLKFELTKEEASELFGANCHYCGSAPSNKRVRHDNIIVIYNGIDRVDSKKGYTSTNVVPCCKCCNFAKNELTTEEFLQHVTKIYQYNVQRLSSAEEYTQVGGNGKHLTIEQNNQVMI